MTERTCGACQECCYQLEVTPMDKPANTRCRHQAAYGCGIYAQRPEACRVFDCAWRIGHIPKSQKPDVTGVVVWATQMLAQSGVKLDHIQANVRPGKHVSKVLMDWLRNVSHRVVVVIKEQHGNTLLQDGETLGRWKDQNFVQMDITPRGKVAWKGEVLRSAVLPTKELEDAWEDLRARAISVFEHCPQCGALITRVDAKLCESCSLATEAQHEH